MPQYEISVPGKGTFRVDSPTELTDQQAWQAVQNQINAPQPNTGAFAAGVKSYLPQVQETFGGLKTLLGVGAERLLGEGQISRGLIESGAASMKEAEAKRQPFMTAERGSFTDALDKGIGAVLTEWLPYQAGSGAMQLLESLGLMGAGALAGSALPGPGTIAGAGTGLVARELAKKGVKEAAEKILKERGEDAAKAYFENEAKKAARKIGGTAALASQAAFYGTGQTTSRAVEEAEKLGGTATDIELARVLPAAAVSTVAEFIGDKIALGALKGIKPGEPGKFVATDLAKNILLNIGLTGTKEVPVEVIQSAAERFGAKLSLTDAQALKEYIDATASSYGMAVAPGVGGGVRQTMTERQLAKDKREQAEIDALQKEVNEKLEQLQFKAPPIEEAPEISTAPAAEVPPVTPEVEAPPVAKAPEAPPAPTTGTPEFLTELGIKPTAAVAKRIKGKSLDDPAVATELETYANKYASEETKPKILEFVQSLKPPVEAPVAPPAAPAAPPVAPVAEESAAPSPTSTAPSAPDRAQVQSTLNTLEDGDTIVTDDGDRVVASKVIRNKNGDVTAIVTPKIDGEGFTGIDFDGLASFVTPQPYIDSTTGERKFTSPATIEKAAAPAATAAAPAPAAPKFEPQIISRQPAPDGMEVHVFTTTDGYGTGLFDADANQYVNGSVTRFAGKDTLPKAQARAAEMLQKATPVEAAKPKAELTDFQKRLKDYWDNTATPAIRNYLSAINSFGVERLEKNFVKPAGMTPREWLESFVSKQSTWDKGRKTGETGIQALSTKNLWPTTDGSGERLRKAMLEAVKALKNAPGSTGDLVSEAFGERAATPKAETPSNISVPASEVEETTTPSEEAKDIQEPTIRNKLKTIAQNLGVLVFETGEKYSSSSGVVTIPTEDKQVEGAQSPEHVFAHELGHAILQKRGVSYKGMPKAELDKWIPGWEKLKAISKAYRPEIHNHKLPKFRRHANKPDEIIADALGSFLLGISSKQDIDPIIKALNLNDYDLGLKGKTEPSAAPAAPTVEAAAPKAEAPPTLDTSGVTPAKGRHPQVQAAAKLLQEKKMSREEFEKYVDAYKPIETIKAETLYPPSSVESMAKAIRGAENKRKINIPIADGTRVGLRMDLPARDQGVPVVSIHEGKPNDDPKTGKPYKSSGKVIGYGSTGYLKDVFFAPRDQEKSLVMGIEPIKEPLQTAEGTWFNLSPEETYARVKELMKDPAWKQIGFDPSRHGYFYDRKTREPVVSASEMYQVGQFLLAKDVQYAPKTEFLYSLGKEQTKQLQDFQQTLRNLLNKFGLKDVGLNIVEGMDDAGSYSQQLIRIAADEANPIRTLRHEAIHALRELGFFTDAQWKSLSKMAKDKWIDQYLKQRNVQGRPLKAGEESRYDAYMREYNGDMEKITEEAVADAFADFDATKPPAGLIQALLKRMKDLFQSIKSALTKVESPEQIFGKVEKGELKPGEKMEAGERKSLSGKRSTQEVARIFGQMVKRAEKELSSALFNWNDSRLNEDKDKIVVYPGRDQRFVRGKEGGKSNVSKAEFIDWLMSDAPFDTSVYGEEITRDAEWKSEIETLRSIVTTPDIRKSLGKATAAAQKALQKQPMPEKGLSHVSKDLTNLAQPIFFPQNKTVLDRIDSMKDRFWQRLAQKTADQFRTIKEYSPLGYMQARLSKSVDGSLEGLLFHGQVFDDGGALNIKKNTKGMMDILKPIGNELDSYLMWVALNRESTLPDTKRSKIPNMDKLVARRSEFAAGELNGKPRVEVYQDVLKQMNQLNKSVLDIALAKGLIDQAGYDKFSNDIYYIPFYKKMEEDGTIEGAQTASGLTSQYFSKELKGGEAPFGDLMENIVRNWSHILSASMKNAAAQTTLNDAMELQAAEPNLKAGLEWKDGKVYSTKSGKPIEAKFDEDGTQLYAEGELRPDLTTGAAGMAKVMVNGQPMYFKVTDDLLMDSISSIGYLGPKSKFLDVARGFKNMLQYGVTASPIFKVNNLIRDSVSALAVSDLKKSPVSNVMKGISLSKPDSPTYISALAGGAIFNFGSAYEGDQAKLIKRLIDQGVEGDTILDSKDKITKALKKTWDAYQHLGDRSEAANRLALYQQLRDKGMSHLEASFMARDLLDFSMQGSWPAFRLITQVVPFMNARIQGLYKLGRDGINPTVRVLYNATKGKEIDANDKIRAAQFATVSAAVMLASGLLYLSFKDDEDFKKRDAWDRDNFWWFKIPSLDIAFRVPKPFEVGAFGTLVERSLEQILDQGAEGKTFGESLKRTLWDTFALNPTPQMFKPLLDIYANKDSFSGAPIESAGLERLSKQERVTEQTSPLAIAMSAIWSTFMPEKLESSPVQMDYAIKGYFGWLGAMASLTSTYAVMPFKEGEYPDARWLDRASLGLVRDLPAPQSAYVTAFYNASKEISQAYADMRHYREMGDAEKVQELLEEKGDKIALAKFYDKTAKNIANVRKQIQLITNDKNLDGAEKKEMIERMKLIMSDLAKQAEEVRKSMKP